MEEENCWICGSQMIEKAVAQTQRGEGITTIKCESCFTDLIVTL